MTGDDRTTPPAPRRWWEGRWWPWPSRAERQANVSLALKTAASSRRAAHKAEVLAADLRSMETDALASAIIEGLQLAPGDFRGERGAKGERGERGAKGERGERGAKGDRGERGERGGNGKNAGNEGAS